jgi:isopropylmalate/homocitrate/citramalate synthase
MASVNEHSDICEVALALSCLYDVPVELDLSQARKVSALVQEAGSYRVDGWRPVVGENLFTRESGAVANQFHIPEAIEPYSADMVSALRRIVLGKKKEQATAAGRLMTDAEFRQLVQTSCAA